MSAVATFRVGGSRPDSPVARILRSMTGTADLRVITWLGDGITVVSEPSPSTDTASPSIGLHPVRAMPSRPCPVPPARDHGDREVGRGDDERDDAVRRRSALDVRDLLHRTARRLIDEQHIREQQAEGGSSDGSVLNHEDDRANRMDTVKRWRHE